MPFIQPHPIICAQGSHSTEVEGGGSAARPPGHGPALPVGQSLDWASHLIALHLSFLICIVGMVAVDTAQGPEDSVRLYL